MRQLKISQKITSRESIALERYLSEISKIDPISPDEEVVLARKIRQNDPEALNKLVNSNLRFVVSVAKQYLNNGLSLNDLINEGNVGLLKAARRFDETRGFKFITFAVWWIRQSILSAIIENSRMIRLPYNKYHSQRQIKETFQSFLQEFEREPSPEEISEIFGMKAEDVYLILQSSNTTLSLDAPVDSSDGEYSILSTIGDESMDAPDFTLLKDSLKEEIKFGLSHLAPRERDILIKLYGIDGNSPISIDDLSESQGITVERIRQVRDHAVRRLRRFFNKQGINPYFN